MLPRLQIGVDASPSVRDAFTSELFCLSPRGLRRLSLPGSSNLRRVVLSPLGSCPALETLDLSNCASLEYLLLQSRSLKALNLTRCGSLAKALVHCAALAQLEAGGCCALECAAVWSDALVTLDLSGA